MERDKLADREAVLIQIGETVSGAAMVETDYSPPPELIPAFDELVAERIFVIRTESGKVALTRNGRDSFKLLKAED
ncbi:MAG: hypothetical protein OXF11_11220 [Deltaproteobacteria bacterium]|nr:hypothetical protein [Deltaproteobacteria bacterium]